MISVHGQCVSPFFWEIPTSAQVVGKLRKKKQLNFSLMNLLLPYPLFFSSHLRFTWYFLMIPVQVFISHVLLYASYIYIIIYYIYIYMTSPMVIGTATERYWQTLVGKVRGICVRPYVGRFFFFGGSNDSEKTPMSTVYHLSIWKWY